MWQPATLNHMGQAARTPAARQQNANSAHCGAIAVALQPFLQPRTFQYSPSLAMPVSMLTPSIPAVPQIPLFGAWTTCKEDKTFETGGGAFVYILQVSQQFDPYACCRFGAPL